MTDRHDDGGRAYPSEQQETQDGCWNQTFDPGMSIWDAAALAAASNPELVTGQAADFYIKSWFPGRHNVNRGEIAAAQAMDFADAFVFERKSRMERGQ